MYHHLTNLPYNGHRPQPETQATVSDLSDLIMPVVNHPEIVEIGFSVTHLPMDSDPELYEVRQIWVRTNYDAERSPHELGLWATSHPTFGKILFGQAVTSLGRDINALWNALRNSQYRDSVLQVFGDGDFVVSRGGITVIDEFEPYEENWR